jgi:phosphopantothenoylcysteine decarboxylase/phosphopantothenate--cysteine ligase
MYEVVLDHSKKTHAVVMAAAVADYAPVKPTAQKIKKTDAELTLHLSPTKDILQTLGSRKNRKVLVGFALETKNDIRNAKEKLRRKNLDLIVLNNPTKPGAAFGGDTNLVTLIGKSGKPEHLPLMSKFDVANTILDRVAKLLKK